MNLHLVLRGSRLQRLFTLVCHVLAGLAVWSSALSVAMALGVSSGLALSAWIHWRRAARPPLAQLLYREGAWTLVGYSQQVGQGRVLGSTRVGRILTLLHFRLGDGRFLALPVWRDSLDPDDYRRLQVVLRWCLK